MTDSGGHRPSEDPATGVSLTRMDERPRHWGDRIAGFLAGVMIVTSIHSIGPVIVIVFYGIRTKSASPAVEAAMLLWPLAYQIPLTWFAWRRWISGIRNGVVADCVLIWFLHLACAGLIP